MSVHFLNAQRDCSGDVHPGEPHDGECEWVYEVECPGVTESCRMWLECRTCDRDALWKLYEETGVALAHGEEHQRMGGMWSTPTDHCYIQWHDDLYSAAGDLAHKPGRYAITHDVGDGTELYLEFAADAAVQA